MVTIKKRYIADFIKAAKSLNYYEESLFYMDFLWGLHPHFPGYISTAKFCFFFLLSVSYVTLTLMMIVVDYEGIETLKKTDILSPSIQVSFILVSYKLNKGIVRNLIEKVDRFWKVEENMVEIKKHWRWTQYAIIFYKSAILCTTIYYDFVALTSSTRKYPTECYQVCDIENDLCYSATFLFMNMSAFVLVWGIYTFDGFFAGSVFKVISQLKMIQYKLSSIDLESQAAEGGLVEIIEHHSFVLGFIDDINDLYSRILFTQFSSLIFSMCIGSFLLTLHGTPTIDVLTQYVVYLSCMFSQVFIYSFGGQVIIDQTASIADATYSTDWFNAKIHIQKAISMIIMRSQQESKISVGGVANLEMRMYLYAAKTSFSFYTMMNQMYEKDLE